jgi:hypothetical protein
MADSPLQTRYTAFTDVAAMIGCRATYEELIEYISNELIDLEFQLNPNNQKEAPCKQ